jgi:hypothetical protein
MYLVEPAAKCFRISLIVSRIMHPKGPDVRIAFVGPGILSEASKLFIYLSLRTRGFSIPLFNVFWKASLESHETNLQEALLFSQPQWLSYQGD